MTNTCMHLHLNDCGLRSFVNFYSIYCNETLKDNMLFDYGGNRKDEFSKIVVKAHLEFS